MTGRLDGKVAIITGASGGIGSASARLLAADGAAVALVDVQPESAQALADQIREAGGAALAIAADVADETQVAAVIERVADTWGFLDVLVNSAGLSIPAPLVDTAVADWERMLAVNLRGPFLMIKHAVPGMRAAGSVINVASVAALMAVRNHAAYTAAKGGLVSLTRVAAAELGPAIRVNCICPGTTLTAMPEQMLRDRGGGDFAAGVAATAQKYLTGRLGQPEEIAQAVLFLAGPQSSFFTGAVIAVDGGVTAQ